jgi:hypothetical protein
MAVTYGTGSNAGGTVWGGPITVTIDTTGAKSVVLVYAGSFSPLPGVTITDNQSNSTGSQSLVNSKTTGGTLYSIVHWPLTTTNASHVFSLNWTGGAYHGYLHAIPVLASGVVSVDAQATWNDVTNSPYGSNSASAAAANELALVFHVASGQTSADTLSASNSYSLLTHDENGQCGQIATFGKNLSSSGATNTAITTLNASTASTLLVIFNESGGGGGGGSAVLMGANCL